MITKTRLYKHVLELVKKSKLEFTAPEVKRNITTRGVNINQKLVNEHLAWVHDNDEISIKHWLKRETGDFDKTQIVFENINFLVVNKPMNTVVEPGNGHLYDNLVYYLSQKLGYSVFAAHRLDKDTRGLMVIAKSEPDKEYLQSQFKLHLVTKKYLALVSGEVTKTLDITNYQARDKSNLLRQKFFWHEVEAMEYDDKARKCHSIITPISYCPDLNQTLVQVQIFTGRMHQIRLQCESLGFPLIDDKAYSKTSPVQYNETPNLGGKFKIIKRKTIHHNEYKKAGLDQEKLEIQSQSVQENPLKEYLALKPIAQLKPDEFISQLDKYKVCDGVIPTGSKIQVTNYFLVSYYLAFKGIDGQNYEFEV
jgi:RluA family pseudouridine synthase